MKPIRILIIAPGGVGPHYHGPGIALYRLLRPLKAGLSVDVIHASTSHDQFNALEGRNIRCGRLADGRFFGSLRFILTASWFIIRHKRRYDTVILSMANILTLVPGAIARMRGVHVVLRVAAIAEVSSQTGGCLGRWLKSLLMRRPNACLAISRAIATELRGAIGRQQRIVFLPNTTDTDRFSPVRLCEVPSHASELGLAHPEDLIVVCVGAVLPRKGQKLLVEALALVPADVSLLLVGPIQDFQYWSEIEAVTRNSGVADRIKHIAFMGDIEKVYKAGHIFALPSDGEGMPNSMLEAMSSGLVPLGTRISGIDELVRSGCGQFVDRSSVSLARAIKDYHADRDRLNAERAMARQVIEQAYTSDSGQAGLLALIRDLADGAP